VKDRAALGIIEAAEQAGLLKPGGTVVEGTVLLDHHSRAGTAGNTGIGMV
jgi:cysteine synthase A